MDKAIIRQQKLESRKSLDRQACAAGYHTICNLLTRTDFYTTAVCVALYVPVHSEVDLLPLLSMSQKTYVFPKVSQESLTFHPAQGVADFIPGAFGIPEPIGTQIQPIEHIDLILVPGVVFDRYGYRIGYGKGFYDRLIKAYPQVVTCGVCLDEFFMERLPVEPWDARVQYIVTQTGVYQTKCEV